MATNKAEFDAFVVCDEEEDFAKDIVSRLNDTNLRCCSVGDNGDPGQFVTKNIAKLLDLSRKCLFILSFKFLNNELVDLYIAMALQRNSRNIITLTDRITPVPQELKITKVICKDSETWWSDLIQEINVVTPDYCQVLDSRNVADLLTFRGLCLANVQSDIYGIFISAHGKFLKVNLEIFSNHQKFHQTICRGCEWLKHPETSVSLVMKNNFLSSVDPNTTKSIVKLCSAVMSVPIPIVTPTSYTSLTSCLNGPYPPDHQKYVSEIFMDTRYELFLQSTSKQKSACFPDFEISNHRKDSFPASYHGEDVEKLIDAGFYYPGFEDTVVCYYCGLCLQIRTIKENNLDPYGVHINIRPTCSYIRSKERDDLDPGNNSQYTKLVQAYDTFSARKKTFDLVDIEQSDFDVKNDNEREKLAENLANAGFYYFGYNSVIGCFSCGLSLEYNPSDGEPLDAWHIHAILSCNCEYLVKQKGKKFAQSLQKVRQPGMPDCTTVTFSWRKFGSKKSTSKSEIVYRPCSYNDKYNKIKITGRIQKLRL